MTRSTVGGVPQTASGLFLKPLDTGTNVVLLVGKDGILSSSKQVTCFKRAGAPFDGSWMQVPNDPGKEFPSDKVKFDQYSAYVPVAVNVGTKQAPIWEVKLWQTNKTNHTKLVELSSEWTLEGMQGKIAKNPRGNWEFNPVPKRPFEDRNATQEEQDKLALQFAELKAKVPSNEDIDKLFGPENAEGVKEYIMRKLDVKTWNAVLAAFGVAAPAGSAEDEDL